MKKAIIIILIFLVLVGVGVFLWILYKPKHVPISTEVIVAPDKTVGPSTKPGVATMPVKTSAISLAGFVPATLQKNTSFTNQYMNAGRAEPIQKIVSKGL